MKIGENALFLVVLLLVVAAGLAFYLSESNAEDARHRANAASSTTFEPSTSSTDRQDGGSTSTTQQAGASSSPTSLPPTTSSVTVPTTTVSITDTTITTSSTSQTSSTTVRRPNPLFEKYRGKGYHQAFFDIQYFCPSCVPAVVASISQEPGVLSKSLGYRQDVSYVIYNPKVVDLERITELAGASGGATLLNDTEI
jgi:hypothetical protein